MTWTPTRDLHRIFSFLIIQCATVTDDGSEICLNKFTIFLQKRKGGEGEEKKIWTPYRQPPSDIRLSQLSNVLPQLTMKVCIVRINLTAC